MADKTLAALTAATAATGGLFYGTQSGADRKFTLTVAGATLAEAASAAAQRTALSCPGLAVANIFSVNGAASTPAMSLTGTVFTGGTATTTKPHFLVEPTGTTSTGWSTAGTMFGVNAPSGFVGALYSAQVAGVKFNDFLMTGGVGAFNLYASSLNIYDSVGGSLRGSYNSGVWRGDAFSVNGNPVYLGSGGVYMAASTPLTWGNGSDATVSRDVGFKRVSAAALQVTDGSTGYGSIDASAYKVGGVAGVSFSGTATSLTIVNGIVTAAS